MKLASATYEYNTSEEMNNHILEMRKNGMLYITTKREGNKHIVEYISKEKLTKEYIDY